MWRHVFIVTYGRSGSTLLMNLLNASDDIRLFGENSDYVYSLFKAVRSLERWRANAPPAGRDTPEHPFHGATSFDFEAARERLLDEARAIFSRYGQSGRKMVGFKEIGYLIPDFAEYLDFLAATYEGAFFIFLTREAKAVARSGFFRNYSEAKVTAAVKSADLAFADYAAGHAESTLLLDYEDLTAKRPQMRELLSRLGVELPEAEIDRVLAVPTGLDRRSFRSLEPGVSLRVDEARLEGEGIVFRYFNIPRRARPIAELRHEGIVIARDGDLVRRVFVTTPAGHVLEAEIGLPSPNVAQEFPQNAVAQAARFRFNNMLRDGDGTYVLSAEFQRRATTVLARLTINLPE